MGLSWPLMIEGLFLFMLDTFMVIYFHKVTFWFLNLLSKSSFNRRTRKAAVYFISLLALARAFYGDLLQSGPSILNIFLKEGKRCDGYNVYCTMQEL